MNGIHEFWLLLRHLDWTNIQYWYQNCCITILCMSIPSKSWIWCSCNTFQVSPSLSQSTFLRWVCRSWPTSSAQTTKHPCPCFRSATRCEHLNLFLQLVYTIITWLQLYCKQSMGPLIIQFFTEHCGATFACAPSHPFSVWPNEEMQLTTVSWAVYFLWYLYMATMLDLQNDLFSFFYHSAFFFIINLRKMISELLHPISVTLLTVLPLMKSGNWKYVAVNKVLTEGGRVLLEHGGSFRSFINPAGNDALKMVELIVEKIPSYRDEATYEVCRAGYGKWYFSCLESQIQFMTCF